MRLVGTRSALFAAASLFTVTAAHADVGEKRSRGTGALAWETREPIVGPVSDKIGGGALQVQVGANLDPMKDPKKPLLSVNMSDAVVLEATWADDQSIDLVLADSGSNDGKFNVEHTLAPHIILYIDAFGFKLTYDYDAATLIQYVPGSEWNYQGLGATTFEPWGFDAAHLKVKAPPLADAQLFSIPLPAIGGSTPLTGILALNATTSPTFDYVTTEAELEGGKITKKGGSWKIPTTDADYLDVPAQVRGAITYSGTLIARPSVTITKIGSLTLPFPLTLDITAAGVDLPYANTPRLPIKVVFPATTFHIPLPNLKALKSLDLGTAKVGAAATRSSDVTNTGEMDGAFTLASSDPQFVVETAKQIVKSKDKHAFDVTFTPAKPGVQTAEITVTSNDPNEPVQTIHVTGVGAASDVPAAETDDADLGPVDTGCGCRTAPASPVPGALAMAAAALAACGLRLRRRARSARAARPKASA